MGLKWQPWEVHTHTSNYWVSLSFECSANPFCESEARLLSWSKAGFEWRPSFVPEISSMVAFHPLSSRACPPHGTCVVISLLNLGGQPTSQLGLPAPQHSHCTIKTLLCPHLSSIFPQHCSCRFAFNLSADNSGIRITLILPRRLAPTLTWWLFLACAPNKVRLCLFCSSL